MPRRAATFVLAVALAALVAFGATATARSATRCPASFTVLHNDSVGTLEDPGGRLRPADDTALVRCAASSLLSRFLDDFDGILPGGGSSREPAGGSSTGRPVRRSHW